MKTITEGQYTFELDTNSLGRLVARMINNNAKKPWNRVKEAYWFKTEEQRQQWVDGRIASLRAWNKQKLERKLERVSFKTTLKPGDILNTSWGYEQTNVDFFQVIAVLSPKRVQVQAIGKTLKNDDMYGSMAGQVVPDVSIKKSIMTCSVRVGEWVRINKNPGCSFEDAHPWNGQPVYCSWGH